MRVVTVMAALLMLAACDQVPGQADASATGATTQSATGAIPPAAAFDYRYAFRLPGNRISAVQEAHAQACEKLGIDKCRITGMRYRLVDSKDVEAMLALRLDPKLARQFGKDATAIVDKSDGMLVDQEITGEDVGTRIQGATKSQAELREELAKIEAELARKVPMVRGNVAPQAAVDRQSLLDRAAEIRGQLRDLGNTKEADEKALSGTPMVFNYGSGNVVPGFDVRSPVRDALQQSWDNFIGGFAVILVIAVSLVPWLLVLIAAVWAFRYARRRWGWFPSGAGYRADSTAEPAPPPPARRKPATTTGA